MELRKSLLLISKTLKMIKKCFALWLIITSFTFAINIEHEVPVLIDSESPINIQVRIDDKELYQVKLFYKFNDNAEYISTTLERISPRIYELNLDVPKNFQKLTYYFWVYSNNQFLYTYPKQNPLSNPFIVMNTQSKLNYFSILTPSIDKPVPYSKSMLVLIRNNFSKNIKFEKAVFNDDENLNVINNSNVLISLRNSFPLREGKNRLTIIGKRKDGSLVNEKYVIYQARKKTKLPFKQRGYIHMYNQVYSGDKESFQYDDFERKYLIDYTLSSKWVDTKFYGALDSRDSDYIQRYSRFYANITDPKSRYEVNIGDSQRSYSPLSLSGKNVRGIAADIDILKLFNRSSKLKTSFIMGKTKTAIQISSGNVTQPTYEQNLIGYQILYSLRKFKSSFQYFHVEDNVSSIDSVDTSVVKPIENHMLSWYLRFRPTPFISFENEIAGSAYYTDSTAPTINIEELEIPDQTRDFLEKHLPIKSSLIIGYYNRSSLQLPLFSRKHILKLGSDWTHPSYTTVVSSFVEADKNENYAKLSSKFFKKKLIINSMIKNKRNNVLNNQSFTKHTNSYRINSRYRLKRVGTFNLLYFLTDKDKDSPTTNEIIDNSLQYITIGLSAIPLKIANKEVKGSVSYTYSNFNDSINPTNNTTANNFNASIVTKIKQYRVSLGVNQSITESKFSGDTNYFSWVNSINKSFYNKKLTVNSRVKLTFGENKSISNPQKSTKFINTYSVDYKHNRFKRFKTSMIRLSTDFISYNDEKSTKDTKRYLDILIRLMVKNTF